MSKSLGQGHTQCCPVPSAARGLCTCNVRSCYVHWFMRCIYKEIHYLTLTPHKTLPSTIYIMWPLHLQSLRLLGPTVKEGGDALTRKYIIWPWLLGQCYTKHCLVPSTSRDLCTCKVWSCYIQGFRIRYIYLRNWFDFWMSMEWWIFRVSCKVRDPQYSWFHEQSKNWIYCLYLHFIIHI